jgi:hypothetical protein
MFGSRISEKPNFRKYID